MHGLDALVISSCERIGCENIFGIVVADLQQSLILPFLRLFRTNLLRHLHIELFILPHCHKIDLAAARLADMDGVSSTAKLQVHDILKAGSHAVRVIAENAVSQGGVRKIEFLLRFQDLLTLQIKAGAAVKQIRLFQLFQVAVNRFVVQRTVFRFQII